MYVYPQCRIYCANILTQILDSIQSQSMRSIRSVPDFHGRYRFLCKPTNHVPSFLLRVGQPLSAAAYSCSASLAIFASRITAEVVTLQNNELIGALAHPRCSATTAATRVAVDTRGDELNVHATSVVSEKVASICNISIANVSDLFL